MRKLGFWKSDWFVGLVVVLIGAVAATGDLVHSLERKAYDLGVRATSRTPSERIAIIAIDDQSIANIGRWPWSRDVHAKMTDMLAGAKAKLIVNNTFFFEPQLDPGLKYVNQMLEVYRKAVPPSADGSPAAVPPGPLGEIGSVLQDAEQALNTDRRLAESFEKAGSVLVPMVFQQITEPQGNPDRPLPEFVVAQTLPPFAGGDLPPPAIQPLYPIEALGTKVAAIGHLNAQNDVDGVIRSEPLILRYYDKFFPALSTLVAAKSLNLGLKDIKLTPGESIQVGKLRIRTDPELQMYTFFYGNKDGKPAFPIDSFYDVYSGKIPVSKYQDKIVLIGPTAAGLGTAQVTPISPATAPVLTMAHTVSSILNEHFFVVPSWAFWVEKWLFLCVALYLTLALPRLKAGAAAIITGGTLVALLAAHLVLMTTQLMWIQMMAACAVLLAGHLALTTKRFLMTERGKEKSDADSAESNRMLGIAYQAQGQFDMAWDKFRQCPITDTVMENLYGLALDFERKRQFNKAESVLRYMAEHNPKFRDLEQRLTRAKAMSETVILGGAQGHPGGTVILPGGGVEKPMLGRYQVEKELGKGAMGVVYLGKDPKIGRVVAIKTMALSQEFEADELQEVKERFFREAETAGRLNHPNIVTIFDAGEEHDLAYIAMEFLKGKDLAPYTKPNNLLQADRAVSIVARVAEALAYAHKNSVVHRDIKPANIMYEMESDTVKVTDFGIARITDSSKTKTGMVLGTPSYMSPEQLAGKKVEGRSDLFSLGATLYQLLSGNLPFKGDSMAQLMFKIANEPHTDIRTHVPDLSPGLVAAIDKSLAKDPEDRFQSGDEMAQALRACIVAGAAPAGTATVDVTL
jgi:CHASE2 domain-containing sensor protein